MAPSETENSHSASAYKASAAANTPAAPPTRAITLLERGAPAAAPVAAGAPDPEAVAVALLDPDCEPDAVADAELEAGCTTLTVAICELSASSLALMVVVSTPWAEPMFIDGKIPLWETVQVMSADVISPFQAHLTSAVQTPFVGSSIWKSIDDEPCFRVKGSQKPPNKPSSWRRRRAAAVVDGAEMGVSARVPAAERADEAADEAADPDAFASVNATSVLTGEVAYLSR